MKLNNNSQIEKACSVDPERRAIHHPFLDIKDGVGTVVATNGACIAMVSAAIEPGDVQGVVESPAFKAARSKQKRPNLWDKTKSIPAQNRGAHTFPDWRQVIPGPGAYDRVFRVALDAEKLLALAAAISTNGTRKVRLDIPVGFSGQSVIEADNNLPIRVTPTRDDGSSKGYLMQARLIE